MNKDARASTKGPHAPALHQCTVWTTLYLRCSPTHACLRTMPMQSLLNALDSEPRTEPMQEVVLHNNP